MTTIELFTSPTCPYCPAAKAVVEQVVGEANLGENTIDLLQFDTWSDEGASKAREYGIMAVPSIFVSGKGIPQKVLLEGAPSKQDLLEAIEMAEGKKSVEKKKNFLEKLFE